jgi:hypothetical protein
MQMDAYLKKEQIGTLFVWVGAPEGGLGGRGASGMSTPNTCQPKKKPPDGAVIYFSYGTVC